MNKSASICHTFSSIHFRGCKCFITLELHGLHITTAITGGHHGAHSANEWHGHALARKLKLLKICTPSMALPLSTSHPIYGTTTNTYVARKCGPFWPLMLADPTLSAFRDWLPSTWRSPNLTTCPAPLARLAHPLVLAARSGHAPLVP